MKKLLSVILAALLLASLCVTALAEGEALPDYFLWHGEVTAFSEQGHVIVIDNERADAEAHIMLTDETVLLVTGGELAEGMWVTVYIPSNSPAPAIEPPRYFGGVIIEDNYLESMEFVVTGEIIEAPTAYMDENGVIMLPLRAIAEALDYEVIWEKESKKVMIGNLYSLTIGVDSYNYARVAPIQLGTAPVIVEQGSQSMTYVPISFFRTVMKMNNAYVFEGKIVIDNEEPMR